MLRFYLNGFYFNYILVPFFQRLKNFKKSFNVFLLGNQSQLYRNIKVCNFDDIIYTHDIDFGHFDISKKMSKMKSLLL